MIQIVSDIDFTISTPQKNDVPFYAKCLAQDPQQCPIVRWESRFPNENGRCVPKGDIEFHRSMGCACRDAFSEEFYTWLASLDMHLDEPILPTINYIRAHPSPVILLTNRDDQCRAKTEQFMARHGIHFSSLLMRQKGDLRPLWDFKVEQINALAHRYERIIWLDDQEPPIRLANVEWRHPDRLGVVGQPTD